MKYLKIEGNNAGLFSTFLITIDNLLYCDKNNIIPTVNWFNPNYSIGNNNNVFNNYFESIGNGKGESSRKEFYHGFDINYLTENNDYKLELSGIINKYIKIKKEIEEKLNSFLNQYFTEDIVGIHIRGMEGDNNGGTSQENFDKLKDLNFYYELLKDVPNKIFIASDNNEVINYLKNKLGDKIITQDIYRCENFVNTGLHFQETDNYKKGEGVLLDVLLLSKCKEIKMRQSNIPVSALLWNPKLKYERYD
jgi:hypothetical protein